MSTSGRVPELHAGDRLTRDEFERRYEAMPHLKKAELIEGAVYLPSPVNHVRHGRPYGQLWMWVSAYVQRIPQVDAGGDSTVRLDLENEPQPDLLLRLRTEHGGRSRILPSGYIEGPPELAAEISASSVSYDLHDKLRAYQRNAVPEYLVWRVDDAAIDWFGLVRGRYERLPEPDGVIRSVVFPGLWLDPKALLTGDMEAVLARLGQGLASAECRAFAARLASAP